MNVVVLMGRLTKDPTTTKSIDGLDIAYFTLALNRGRDKQGNDRGADFPEIVCFGKTANIAEAYLSKGMLISIEGSINTSRYKNRDDEMIYKTQVIANKIHFTSSKAASNTSTSAAPKDDPVAAYGELSDDDIPF